MSACSVLTDDATNVGVKGDSRFLVAALSDFLARNATSAEELSDMCQTIHASIARATESRNRKSQILF